ncbi:cytochrome P450 [Lecanosticta acicola]|uniref:Cytochrome P450 n=1 Tax=Lecanosticta acicola TaxID=111012 RepID=A0AAI9EBW6_9PEZI|nr:cytochrome P450 [Lecanosticta acicola]
MNFSTLLIAKPLPFRFQLRVRDQARAMKVTQQWIEHQIEGEFQDSKMYWNGTNGGDKDSGWGQVFL